MIPECAALIIDEDKLAEPPRGEETKQQFVSWRIWVEVGNLQVGGGV